MHLSHYFDHTTTWSNQPPWSGHLSSSWQTTGYDSCESDGWVSIDATGYFQTGANTDYIYLSMALIGAPEWHSDTWKRFRSGNSSYNPPYARVNFTPNEAPNTPTQVKPTGDCYPSCTSGSKVRVLRPTLQAVVSDSNPAHTLNVQMEVRNEAKTSVVESTTIPGVASGSTVTWQTPELTNGTTYNYRVRAQDNWGAWGAWSSYYTFTVDTAGPGTPTSVGVTGDCWGSCSSPAVLRSAKPTFTATAPHPFGDVLSVRFEVLNASSTVIASTTKTNVPAGTAVTWQPGSNLPQGPLRLRVRSTDVYNRTSSWSPSYHFTVDTQAPGAPTVSSPFYHHKDTGTWNGGVGVPGPFTVSPNGATDVLAFEYRMNGGATPTECGGASLSVCTVNVAAGASATFSIKPTADLEQVLEVRSIDQAGWASSWVPYPFLVRAQPVDVAYWKFDEPSGTVAAAATGGSDYDGTVVGGASWVGSGINPADPGASGNAVSLDGANDYVAMPRVLATNHAAGFSVSAWVKPASLSGSRVVVSQQGSNGYAFRLFYNPDVNAWCFGVRDSDASGAGTAVVCSSQPAQVGVWTHLVGVYDAASGKLRLYVNGGPLNGTSTPGTANEAAAPSMWASTGAFRVGRGFSGEYLHGLVDEVRAYQRALPEVEARQMFRDCLIGDCPPVPPPTDPTDLLCDSKDGPECIGEWRLDEGVGSTVGDSSGLGNALSLNGGAAWTTDGYNDTAGIVLDGTSGYLAADGPVLLTDQSFTVSAWVRLASKANWASVISQNGTVIAPFRLEYRVTTDHWCMRKYHADVPSSSSNVACGGTPQIGVWTHLVGQYDSATRQLRLYVDGSLVGTTTYTAADWQGTQLFVGRTLHTSSAGVVNHDYFPGTIDQVRVYQGVLSDAQVSALYAEQLAPPRLRAWYEFEEPGEPAALDYTGNGNDAVLSASGAGWTDPDVDPSYDGSTAVELDGVAGQLSTVGPVLDTRDSFSVSAWVYNTDASTTVNRTAVAQDGVDTSAFFLQKRQGAWAFVKMPSDDSSGPVAATGGSAPVNAWVHLVGVYDAAAGELRLYVDGTLVATAPCSCSGWSATGPLTIGRATWNGAASDWWHGRIDGVRVYQGALSGAQVAAVYNGLDV